MKWHICKDLSETSNRRQVKVWRLGTLETTVSAARRHRRIAGAALDSRQSGLSKWGQSR
jgi:hypothetical protein